MDRIVAVGASQGGVAALRTLVRKLPADFEAPVLVVQHIGAESILPSILTDLGRMPAVHAQSGDTIRSGCIHVAPPGQHMMIIDGHIELTRGPRENWSRPAIDPLFRSAAAAYGKAVIGVVLTGRLNDGTAGLYEIKRQGGITMVQEPDEAEAPAMPQSALANVEVDYRLPLADIPGRLVELVRAAKQEAPGGRPVVQCVEPEIRSPSAQSCPECGGAMRAESLGPISRFRCHIGHVMTAEVLAAAQVLVLENQLGSSLRLLNERAGLCRDIAMKRADRGDLAGRDAWLQAAEEAQRREVRIRELTELDWARPESKLEDIE